MNSTQRKNSVLVQQLCRHIAILEETNARLHEQLVESDKEKQQVC